MSFCIVLSCILGQLLKMGVVDAAKIISIATGKGERTVCGWRATFLVNDSTFPESLIGKYKQNGVLWQNEDLNKQATKHVQCCKRQAKYDITHISSWVNETLLQNNVLKPEFPRRIRLETARIWLHELGFSKISAKKGQHCPDSVRFGGAMESQDSQSSTSSQYSIDGQQHCDNTGFVNTIIILMDMKEKML